MGTEDLHEICASIALKGKSVDPQGHALNSQEIKAIMKYCREKICDADQSYGYKLFYNEVYDILYHEVKELERLHRSPKASPNP